MEDTIAAIATARGAGGIAIVRISGPEAEALMDGMFVPARSRGRFESHRLMYGHVVDAGDQAIDEVMAVLMRGPGTYTREDVAELHCHGGAVCASAVLARAVELGARVAEPGEFTRRAFMNGRIDLTRAEAVMQLIGAGSQAAARASIRQLEGGVSGFVRRVSDRLTELMALIEASTDFPDEVEEEAAAETLKERLLEIIADIEARCDARGARILRDGASVVLAGRPNVGKSSLMNALLDQDRAIVTDIPGTTRDVLTERLTLDGVAVELSDTAGRRDTRDPIERIGVDRAQRAAEGADVVLIVLDAAAALTPEDDALLRQADDRTVVCLNKTDLPGIVSREEISGRTHAPVFEISARSGEGVAALIRELSRRVAVNNAGGALMAQRHIELAQSAANALKSAVNALEAGLPLDVAAIDLREALAKLGEITGENATKAVIDRVFSSFCVGK